ncbi:YdcF family protein [Neobacillus mesonae]|nr:YdcF family protein [Neobacillus mesonae]
MYPFDCITELVFVPDKEIMPADIILVPGGTHTNPMKIASKLYHSGIAPYILPSGGFSTKVDKTEWEFLRDIAVSLGVPEVNILKEDQAKNTFDNARNSWEVIRNNDMDVKRAIIVCKSYFSRRALMTYQTVFPPSVNIQVLQDDYRVNRRNWFYDETYIKLVLTEAEKITRYFGHHIPNWVKQTESSSKY